MSRLVKAWGDVKDGDRVRVTVEGVVTAANPRGFNVVLDEEQSSHALGFGHGVPLPVCEILDPPLAVGDRVTWGNGFTVGELIAARGDRASVWYDDSYFADVKFDILRRAE